LLKKCIIFALTLSLVLSAVTGAMAAFPTVKAPGSFEVDTIWSIDWDDPFYEFGINYNNNSDDFFAWGKYYLNDFTFADLFVGEDYFNLNGSYLFDNGFFIGGAFIDDNDQDCFIIAPGYRFSLGERSYVALGLNYFDYDDDEEFAFDINSKLYFDDARLIANLLIPEDSPIELYIEPTFKISEDVVVGGALGYLEDADEELAVAAGLTWQPENWIVDTILAFNYNHADAYYFKVGGLYTFNNQFGIGADISKLEDTDTEFALKFKYQFDEKSDLKFYYEFEAENLTLTYFSNF